MVLRLWPPAYAGGSDIPFLTRDRTSCRHAGRIFGRRRWCVVPEPDFLKRVGQRSAQGRSGGRRPRFDLTRRFWASARRSCRVRPELFARDLSQFVASYKEITGPADVTSVAFVHFGYRDVCTPVRHGLLIPVSGQSPDPLPASVANVCSCRGARLKRVWSISRRMHSWIPISAT